MRLRGAVKPFGSVMYRPGRDQQDRTGNQQRMGTARTEPDESAFQTILQSAISGAVSSIMSASRSHLTRPGDLRGDSMPGPSGITIRSSQPYNSPQHNDTSPRYARLVLYIGYNHAYRIYNYT